MASSARLEQEHRAGTALGVDVQGESFLERGGEGRLSQVPLNFDGGPGDRQAAFTVSS
jgi:hypothetical protein